MKKKPLYNFGISQDDVLAENKALNFKSGDHLLCVASAGEVPLNIMAMRDINIDAVDIAVNQLHLCYLKLAAIRQLEPAEASSFLGFADIPASKRTLLFSKVAKELPEDSLTFWVNNYKTIEAGVIRQARFEKYILIFGRLGLAILGKKKLMGLFETNSIEQQQQYFDRYLGKRLLKMIFKIAFHPRVYQKGVWKVPVYSIVVKGISPIFFMIVSEISVLQPWPDIIITCSLRFLVKFYFRKLYPNTCRKKASAV